MHQINNKYIKYFNYKYKDVVLEMLDKDREAAIKKYRELMMEKADKDYDSVKIIGDEHIK